MPDDAVQSVLRAGESLVETWPCTEGTVALTDRRLVLVPGPERPDRRRSIALASVGDPVVRAGTGPLTYSLIAVACLGWAAVAGAYAVSTATLPVLAIAAATGVAGLAVGALAYRRRDPPTEVTVGTGTEVLTVRFPDESVAGSVAAALRERGGSP